MAYSGGHQTMEIASRTRSPLSFLLCVPLALAVAFLSAAELRAASGDVRWTLDFGRFASSAVVSGDSIFAWSEDYTISGSYVVALDLDGDELWRTPLEKMWSLAPTVEAGHLYFVGQSGSSVSLYCLSAASGTELWRRAMSGHSVGAPLVFENRVFVGGDEGTVYAVEAATGNEVWTGHALGDVWGSSLAGHAGRLYFGTGTGHVLCVDADDGDVNWSRSLGGTPVDSSPAIVDGKVYIGAANGLVYCLDSGTGQILWSRNTGDPIGLASPAVGEGRVVIANETGFVTCLNASDGAVRWTVDASDAWVEDLVFGGSPAISDGSVYLAGFDGIVRCLRLTDGALQWSYGTWTNYIPVVRQSPAISAGRVVLTDWRGTVHCLTAQTSGQGDWPRFRHDARNTGDSNASAGSATLSSLTIEGPATIDEGSSAQYTATARFTDGSSRDVTDSCSWSENSSYATVSSHGLLVASNVPSDATVTLSAEYTTGGVTRTDTHRITILDEAGQPTPETLQILGPSQIPESSTASYLAEATFDDSSTADVSTAAQWSEISPHASVDGSGTVTTGQIASDQTFELRATYTAASTTVTATRTITIRNQGAGPLDPCVSGPETLCLQANRFKVEVDWRNQRNNQTGEGQAISSTQQTGYFWFFNQSNIELVVKILDGSGSNGYFWVFYGALSDVEYWIKVTDTATGATKTYHNSPGDICGDADTRAFAAGGSVAPGAASPDDPFGAGEGPSSDGDDVTTQSLATNTATPLRLHSNRFEVTVDWKNPRNNQTGSGMPIPSTQQTGYFWFFNSSNIELVVKILDGRGSNGYFWVFYGALSDVEYWIHVKDTQTGATKTYHNLPYNICGDADTRAFDGSGPPPTCTYGIQPTQRNHSASAATSSVAVTAPPGCSWAAHSNAGWITVTSGSTGSGNGTVAYSVAANGSTDSRTGTISVAGKTFTVTQAGSTSGGEQEITVMLPGGVEMELVHIPAGTFMMGSPAEERERDYNEDLHQVVLTRDYYLGKTEVTQAQWRAVMGTNPSNFPSCGDDCPVENVTWNEVASSGGFIEKLNEHLASTGQAGAGMLRLPTEAEWERAARADTQTEFSFSAPSNWNAQCGSFPEADAHMWWCGNSWPQTQPVASKLPNGFGLYDMHGNVAEWVADWYKDRLGTSPMTDPTGPSSGSNKVARSGSYDTFAWVCRSAKRNAYSPGISRYHFMGFRIARFVQ
jgi:outer membrane protein assembly factor BamB/formylglycine-generating enzyme required for sulfatase activity